MEFLPGESRIGNYVLLKQLGSGAFAQVWLASHMITNIKVAIKIISKSTLDTPESKTRFSREMAILKKLRHPFIAEFFESLENESYHFLILEFAEGGNILEFINSHQQLSEPQVRHIFSELVFVLDYLHNDQHIAHRDLKAENVLLDRFNNIRVIDFGLSNTFTSNNPNLKTACGSPAYAAPEMIKGQPYTKAADIWSAGILLYSMVAGQLPFDDENVQRLLQKIVYTDVRYPGFFSPPLVDLLRKMLAKNPESRINLEKIKEHHWFSQIEYASLVPPRFTERSDHEIIDKEIVDNMIQFGFDCHPLHQQLLTGEFTELTSIYRQLTKDKTTNLMKDMFQNLRTDPSKIQQNTTSQTPTSQPQQQIDLHGGKVTFKVRNNAERDRDIPIPSKLSPRPVNTPQVARTFPMKPVGVAAPVGGGGPRMLQVPAPVQIATRRLSRPVAFHRTMEVPKRIGTVSHETP